MTCVKLLERSNHLFSALMNLCVRTGLSLVYAILPGRREYDFHPILSPDEENQEVFGNVVFKKLERSTSPKD
jgi:hypothetical protein